VLTGAGDKVFCSGEDVRMESEPNRHQARLLGQKCMALPLAVAMPWAAGSSWPCPAI
jgi:enoyl-CoA hydratase/carnithine racemase